MVEICNTLMLEAQAEQIDILNWILWRFKPPLATLFHRQIMLEIELIHLVSIFNSSLGFCVHDVWPYNLFFFIKLRISPSKVLNKNYNLNKLSLYFLIHKSILSNQGRVQGEQLILTVNLLLFPTLLSKYGVRSEGN